MKCRKCGQENRDGEWVCHRCDYILDSSFLGSDILNERTRDGSDDEPPPPLPPEEDFGGDALILGRLGDADSDDNGVVPIHSDRTGGFMPVGSGSKAPASVYVTAEIRNLLMPDRVLQQTSDAHERLSVLSEYEVQLFGLVDGLRTVEQVQQESGLGDHDLCVTMAMLLDKALVEAAPPSAVAERRARAAAEAAQGAQEHGQHHGHEHGQEHEHEHAHEHGHKHRDIEDSTSELDNLAPLAEPPRVPKPAAAPKARPAPVSAVVPKAVLPGANAPTPKAQPKPAPRAPEKPFDDLEMVPLPTPSPAPPLKKPPSTDVRPPQPQLAAASAESVVPRAESVRPAAPMAPAMRPAGVPGMPGAAKSGLNKAPTGVGGNTSGPVPKQAAPAGKSKFEEERAARAAKHYDSCMADLAAGRAARAWSFARMALEADPTNEKYQTLVHDWHKQQGGAHGERASSPQELMAAAQAAENSGDPAAAAGYLKKLIAISPNSAAAHNKLAVLLATRLGQFRAAYNAAIKAVELDPNNMSYQSNMMKILARCESEDAKHGEDSKSSGGGLFGRLLKKK